MSKIMKKKTVLITAGPTREYIDPVRYISNGSSGKMGYTLAEEAYRMGMDVILVSGPTNLVPPRDIKFIWVSSAKEMLTAAKKYFPQCDIFISCAAVSDYRPAKYFSKKIKKNGSSLNLKLLPNPDILLSLVKSFKQFRIRPKFIVGFALETENLIANALAKMKNKRMDMIVANNPDSIGSVRTSCALITKEKIMRFQNIPKIRLAKIILSETIISL